MFYRRNASLNCLQSQTCKYLEWEFQLLVVFSSVPNLLCTGTPTIEKKPTPHDQLFSCRVMFCNDCIFLFLSLEGNNPFSKIFSILSIPIRARFQFFTGLGPVFFTSSPNHKRILDGLKKETPHKTESCRKRQVLVQTKVLTAK
jgi:hypothetical protein